MRRSEREIKRRPGENAAVPYQKEALQETIRRSKTAFNEKDAAHPLTSSVGRAPISESAGGGQAALLLVLWGVLWADLRCADFSVRACGHGAEGAVRRAGRGKKSAA